MEKIVYLWNDLGFFLEDANKINSVWSDFVLYIDENRNQKTQQYYLFNEEFNECIMKREYYKEQNILSIGTRPTIIMSKNKLIKFNSIKPIRARQPDGSSDFITMGFEDKKTLYQYVKNETKQIVIVEDVIVNGKTMKYVLDCIETMKFKGLVIVDVWFANRYTCEILQSNKYSFKLRINVKVFMEGKPIEQSTLICLYDLLFNNIDDKNKYYERMDLIGIFLPNSKNQLYELIMKSNLQLSG